MFIPTVTFCRKQRLLSIKEVVSTARDPTPGGKGTTADTFPLPPGQRLHTRQDVAKSSHQYHSTRATDSAQSEELECGRRSKEGQEVEDLDKSKGK